MRPKQDFILDHADWPAFLVDHTCRIRCANASAVEMFGSVVESESTLLSSIWASSNEESPEQFLARPERASSEVTKAKFLVKGGATVLFQTYLCPITKEGQKFYVFQLFHFPLSLAAAAPASPILDNPPTLDLGTAQKQKLDCAMQLIRSVVLDFNNALTSILGHTSLILSKMDRKHAWYGSLVEVEKSAEKAAEVASDLGTFSRQEKDTRTMTSGNLNDLLRRTVELFQVQAPGALHLIWSMDLEQRLYAVQFDEAKMQQAFLKVFDNAVQAVSQNPSIGVRTRNLEVKEMLRDGTATIAPGHYVCVEITDNGCGIPPDVLPRIFDPFFTTKSNHRGLGLAWVYGIVTNHGGSVAVNSQVGVRTTVRLYLPAEKRFVRDRQFKDEELVGNQTILMVDDEPLLLTMGQTVLSAYGYHVLTAINGEKALEVFSALGSDIDLVITDLVMPNMSGRELIERLRRIAPKLKVISCSGYVHPASKEEDDSYLKKPFTSQDLLQKVKQSLIQSDLT